MLSVIICTYNRSKYIYNVLESLAKGTLPPEEYEIVLIDNNCTDNTSSELDRFAVDWPQVQLRRFVETHQGLSYARNRGIREAKGDVLIFLDDDAFPGPDYLSNIKSVLGSNPHINCFGGEIVPQFEDGQTPEWLCDWNLSWVSGLKMRGGIREFTKGYPIGANMGFRKAVFKDCGLFNTSLGRSKGNLMGGEEKDIFQRIENAGYKIHYIPEIEVRHMIPPSRTTLEYIAKLGQGVGMSERIRCKALGTPAYIGRLFSEIVKWGATLVLWLKFILQGKPACGNSLMRFRWNVSKTLILDDNN